MSKRTDAEMTHGDPACSLSHYQHADWSSIIIYIRLHCGVEAIKLQNSSSAHLYACFDADTVILQFNASAQGFCFPDKKWLLCEVLLMIPAQVLMAC